MIRMKFTLAVCACVALLTPGCIKKVDRPNRPAFPITELDACLAIVVDRSGSFTGTWMEHGYPLLERLMLQFFDEQQYAESRVVIAQFSGHDEFILWEGTPAELHERFKSPDELAQFIDAHANPLSSPVYEATREVIDYVGSIQGITSKTRVLTVVLSDLVDGTFNEAERKRSGADMLASLTRYREAGGALALYYVDRNQQALWHAICQKAGFTAGSYVITTDVVASPPLPSFQ